MSRLDTDLVCTRDEPADGATLLAPREVPLGGPRALVVRRTLPHRVIRTIGAWCFVDHFGPAPVAEQGMHVPPHPHIGLQAVTWLYAGHVLHRDGLGSSRLVRPGELNLMTAGCGIAHAEDSVPAGPQTAVMHGLQLWVALPDAVRHQPPHFEHHGDLPTVQVGAATATVLLGTLAGVTSPAATYSPIVGADLDLPATGDGPARARIPLDPAFEHGVVAVDGDLRVDGGLVPRGALLHLPPGRPGLTVEADGAARAFLLGGAPFGERLVMWWNFVGRDHDDIAGARADWEAARADRETAPAGPTAGRFAAVDHPAPALPAPALPTTRLIPR